MMHWVYLFFFRPIRAGERSASNLAICCQRHSKKQGSLERRMRSLETPIGVLVVRTSSRLVFFSKKALVLTFVAPSHGCYKCSRRFLLPVVSMFTKSQLQQKHIFECVEKQRNKAAEQYSHCKRQVGQMDTGSPLHLPTSFIRPLFFCSYQHPRPPHRWEKTR